jgi:Fungal Zn(2)-Cys(6) binuclear cluster domain
MSQNILSPIVWENPPVKRARVLRSCLYCRKKKIKCDENLPCKNCVRASRADSCVQREQYSPRKVPDTTSNPSEPAHDDSPHFNDGIPPFRPAPLPAPPPAARQDPRPAVRFRGLQTTRSLLLLVRLLTDGRMALMG